MQTHLSLALRPYKGSDLRSDLCVVLLASWWHVVYVLLGRRLMSGRDVILILLWFDCVVHIHLSNPSWNYHLQTQNTERQ